MVLLWGHCVAFLLPGGITLNNQFMKERPVFPLLVSMALPMVISMMVNALYNIVDSFFVARISEQAMTALSLVFPVQNLINAIAIGFGVGINALIALYSGAGEHTKADTAATHGMVFALLHGVVILAVSIPAMPAFLRLFTKDEAVVAMGVQYATTAFAFAPVIMAGLAFEKQFQAVGRMSTAMAAMLCGSLANLVLDPLLIFGLGPCPKLGIRGAALATGAGQVLTLVVYLVVYRVKPIPVKLRRACLKRDAALDKKLYSIGVPAILNLALPSLLVFCLNSILAAFADSYVVVLGIYYKLQTFLYLPASGIVQGMRPILSFNYGAGEKARVQKIFRLALALCGAIMAAGTVLCLAAAGPLMGLFTQNPETVAAGGTALRLICLGFVVSAVSVVVSGALEALGRGLPSLVISLCRYVVVMIPLAFVLSRFLGASGVWHAFWLTEAVTAAISWGIYRRTFRGEGRSAAQ